MSLVRWEIMACNRSVPILSLLVSLRNELNQTMVEVYLGKLISVLKAWVLILASKMLAKFPTSTVQKTIVIAFPVLVVTGYDMSLWDFTCIYGSETLFVQL